MSDLETKVAVGIGKFEQMAEKNPFFTFSKPYLNFIGKGKIFNLVYIVMAAVNLLLPFAVMITVIKSGVLGYGGAKYVVAFIFSWLVITFACWIGFQLWWDRRKRLATVALSEFIVIPLLSEMLQTFGEWVGTFVGIIGAGVGIISIFLSREASELLYYIPMGSMLSGVTAIIVGPVAGFLIMIMFRFFADMLGIFAALANNTKEIATNIKNKASGN